MGLAGCGASPSTTDDFSGEEKAVAQVVEDISTAAKSGDATQICSQMLSDALVDRMKAGKSSCSQELDASLDEADDFDLEVKDVTVTGTTATAKVEGRDGSGDRVATFRFVKESGKWKAEAIS
jgi:S-adenosylmethionine synthetase